MIYTERNLGAWIRTSSYLWLKINKAEIQDVTVYMFVKQVILGMFQIFLVTIYNNDFFEIYTSSKMATKYLSCSLDSKREIDNRMFNSYLQIVIRCHIIA